LAKEDKAKIKMTVIHFETESDNSTLQENIRAITQTLTRALASQPRVVYAPAHLPPPSSSTGTALETEIDDNSDILDGEVESSSSTSSPSKEKSRRHQSRTPQPLELDLVSGSMPLKAFLEQKNPDGDTRKYLAIAYWLKKYSNTNEVTMDHAYTCYRHMGWQVPADAAQPLRTMKSRRYGWMTAGSVRGAYTINHLGENVVEQMGNE
jgi:hypothetical protein